MPVLSDYEIDRLTRICRVLRKWVNLEIPKKFASKYSARQREDDQQRLEMLEELITNNTTDEDNTEAIHRDTISTVQETEYSRY